MVNKQGSAVPVYAKLLMKTSNEKKKFARLIYCIIDDNKGIISHVMELEF